MATYNYNKYFSLSKSTITQTNNKLYQLTYLLFSNYSSPRTVFTIAKVFMPNSIMLPRLYVITYLLNKYTSAIANLKFRMRI